MTMFDSIVLSSISVPEIPESSECRYISGKIYYGYRIENSKSYGPEVLRGICNEIDSLLSYQSDIIFEKLVPFLNIDSTKNYFVGITLKYDGNYSNDSIFIEDNKVSNPLPPRLYVIAKEEITLISSCGPSIHICIDTNRKMNIPKNLDECFVQLGILLDEESKRNIIEDSEERFVTSLHYTFGLFLWDYWELWEDSVLSKYFIGLGIEDPETMTKIIFTSYYRYLTGKEVELNKQILHYNDHKENQ